jgi:hypothetical protein
VRRVQRPEPGDDVDKAALEHAFYWIVRETAVSTVPHPYTEQILGAIRRLDPALPVEARIAAVTDAYETFAGLGDFVAHRVKWWGGRYRAHLAGTDIRPAGAQDKHNPRGGTG